MIYTDLQLPHAEFRTTGAFRCTTNARIAFSLALVHRVRCAYAQTGSPAHLRPLLQHIHTVFRSADDGTILRFLVPEQPVWHPLRNQANRHPQFEHRRVLLVAVAFIQSGDRRTTATRSRMNRSRGRTTSIGSGLSSPMRNRPAAPPHAQRCRRPECPAPAFLARQRLARCRWSYTVARDVGSLPIESVTPSVPRLWTDAGLMRWRPLYLLTSRGADRHDWFDGKALGPPCDEHRHDYHSILGREFNHCNRAPRPRVAGRRMV